MKVQKFGIADFETYQSWYKDKLVRQYLGATPDEAWLGHILQETDGIQYAFYDEQVLVGVMGIVFPDAQHPHYYITDIVVNPTLRGKGIGCKMLYFLTKLHPLKAEESYKAFVDVENDKAQLFLKKLGWQLLSEHPDKEDMLTFTFKDN